MPWIPEPPSVTARTLGQEIEAVVEEEVEQAAHDVAGALRVGTPIDTGATAADWHAARFGRFEWVVLSRVPYLRFVRVRQRGVAAAIRRTTTRIRRRIDDLLGV